MVEGANGEKSTEIGAIWNCLFESTGFVSSNRYPHF